jgi:hypothetical protein
VFTSPRAWTISVGTPFCTCVSGSRAPVGQKAHGVIALVSGPKIG